MGSWARKALAALAALALIAGTSASAQVPDQFARELAQKLAHAETLLGQLHYARAAGPFPGSLTQGHAQRFTVTLRAGQDYRIVGVCDERCRDLDLRLYDPNERLIGQDTMDDAVPVIHVQPGITGQHTIEVALEHCRGAPCWYAVNVYSR